MSSSTHPQNLKYSTQAQPQKVPNGAAHQIIYTSMIIMATIAAFIFFTLIRQIVENFLGWIFFFFNLIPGVTLQTTGMFANVDLSTLSILYTVLFILFLMSFSLFKEKGDGIRTAVIFTAFFPILIYLLFIEVGRNYLGGDIVQWVSQILIGLIAIVGLIFFITFLTTKSEELQGKIGKEIQLMIIVLGLGWFILFLVSGSAASIIFQEQVRQEVDTVQETTNNFAHFWRCEVLAGNLRGTTECIEATEEVSVRRDAQEPFIFQMEGDRTGGVIREGATEVQSIFFINPPSTVRVSLREYSCRVGTQRTTYQIPEQYSQLTQEVPRQGVRIALPCPIEDKIDWSRYRRGDTITVFVRVEFSVEDRVSQRIPYIDCGHSFFSNQPFGCESLAREYFEGNINDPRIINFMQTISDEVIGVHSARGRVTRLRNLLPLYLNSDETFFSTVGADYSIILSREGQSSNFNIRNVTINNIRTPAYIRVPEESILRTSVPTPGTNARVEIPIRIVSDNSFTNPNNDIGGSEFLRIEYTINQFIEQERRVTIQIDPPEAPEEEPTIGEIITSEDETNNEQDDEITTTSNEDGDGSSNIPEQDQQRDQTPAHEQGSRIDEETGEEIHEDFDFDNEFVTAP